MARWFLRILGWEPCGTVPDEARYVLVAAPHTSNWDLPLFVAFAWFFEVKVSWMGKHVLFRPPQGWLFRALGGIPVVRHRQENVVAQMAKALTQSEALVFAIAPEGTRRCVDHWKSGFYHIAATARVPIVLSFLDYGRRQGGFGPVVRPSGSIRNDMNRIRAFYDGKQGKHPEQFGAVRLLEEETASDPQAPSSQHE